MQRRAPSAPGISSPEAGDIHPMTQAQKCRHLKVICDTCGWQARSTEKHIKGRDLRCPDEHCSGHLARG